MSESETPTTQTSLPKPGARRRARVQVPEEATSPSTPDAAVGVAERPRRNRADVPTEFRALHVDPKKVKIAPAQKTRQYWCGAFADAPFDCKHIAGVTFQKWSGIVEADPKTGALILDRARPGNVIDLEESQIESVLAAAAAKVIRVNGNRADATGNYRCDSFNVNAPGFRPTSIDRPIAEFIYMVEIDDLMPRGWRDERPPAMYQPE